MTFSSQKEAMDWMLNQIDDDCIDNERFAYLDDLEEMKKYQKAQNDGCCGFFDEEIIVANRRATIGCNYGH